LTLLIIFSGNFLLNELQIIVNFSFLLFWCLMIQQYVTITYMLYYNVNVLLTRLEFRLECKTFKLPITNIKYIVLKKFTNILRIDIKFIILIIYKLLLSYSVGTSNFLTKKILNFKLDMLLYKQNFKKIKYDFLRAMSS